jgi:hypothetical protein
MLLILQYFGLRGKQIPRAVNFTIKLGSCCDVNTTDLHPFYIDPKMEFAQLLWRPWRLAFPTPSPSASCTPHLLLLYHLFPPHATMSESQLKKLLAENQSLQQQQERSKTIIKTSVACQEYVFPEGACGPSCGFT